MEKWHIQHLNGDTIIVLFDIHDVADYEIDLLNKKIPHKTDYYVGTKLVGKSER